MFPRLAHPLPWFALVCSLAAGCAANKPSLHRSPSDVAKHAAVTEAPVSEADFAPVSYTHLDVYKRQTMGNLLILCLYITKVVMYCQFRWGRDIIRQVWNT